MTSFLTPADEWSLERDKQMDKQLLLFICSLDMSLINDVTPFIGPVFMRVDGCDHAPAPC